MLEWWRGKDSFPLDTGLSRDVAEVSRQERAGKVTQTEPGSYRAGERAGNNVTHLCMRHRAKHGLS